MHIVLFINLMMKQLSSVLKRFIWTPAKAMQILRKIKQWWWWIGFVVWLTDKRRLALFPGMSLWHNASRIWTCTEPEFGLCWMKLCSSDNHYTTSKKKTTKENNEITQKKTTSQVQNLGNATYFGSIHLTANQSKLILVNSLFAW